MPHDGTGTRNVPSSAVASGHDGAFASAMDQSRMPPDVENGAYTSAIHGPHFSFTHVLGWLGRHRRPSWPSASGRASGGRQQR